MGQIPKELGYEQGLGSTNKEGGVMNEQAKPQAENEDWEKKWLIKILQAAQNRRLGWMLSLEGWLRGGDQHLWI